MTTAEPLAMNTQTQLITNPGVRGWVVTMIASLYFFYEFIQMNMFNSLSTYLLDTFHLTSTQLGNLSACYFYTDTLLVIPAGLIIDRFSTRYLIVGAMFLSSIATICFGLAHSIVVLAIARLVVGACAAFCFLSVIRLASRWFPTQQMALVTGFVVTWAMLGGMIAQTPFSYLMEITSPRTAIIIDGTIGLIMMCFIYFVVRDYPPHHRLDNYREHKQAATLGLWSSLKIVASNPYNWLCGVYTTLLNLPIFILGAIWGILYLSQVHGLSAITASEATAMLFFGTICGCPAFGWLSDKMGKRKLPMLLGAALSLVSVLILIEVSGLNFTWIVVLFFSIGFFTSAQIISYPLVSELNLHSLTSSANSIISVVIMASGFIVQPLFGALIKTHWRHTFTHGTPLYTLSDYHHAMFIMPASFLVAFILAFFIKETHCKQQSVDLSTL